MANEPGRKELTKKKQFDTLKKFRGNNQSVRKGRRHEGEKRIAMDMECVGFKENPYSGAHADPGYGRLHWRPVRLIAARLGRQRRWKGCNFLSA